MCDPVSIAPRNELSNMSPTTGLKFLWILVSTKMSRLRRWVSADGIVWMTEMLASFRLHPISADKLADKLLESKGGIYFAFNQGSAAQKRHKCFRTAMGWIMKPALGFSERHFRFADSARVVAAMSSASEIVSPFHATTKKRPFVTK